MADAARNSTGAAAAESAPHPYSALAPRFWHGMLPVTWVRLLLRHRLDVSLSRVPTVLAICIFSCLNLVFWAVDAACYGWRARRTKIKEPPVFILGHWRSGTTLLHELMIRDAQFTFPTTIRCFAPSHFLLTERFVSKVFGFVLPDKRPMDNMDAGWDRPQEDEFALCNMGVPSPYLMMAFPNHGAVHEEYLTLKRLPSAERERWKQALLLFLRRITFRDRKRIVVKSPTHTARVRTILEMFPDARFVHIVRDPLAIFPSAVRTWKSLNQVQGLHVPEDESWLEEFVLRNLEEMYDSFNEDRELLDPSQIYEIRYEELIADPKAALRQIYERLNLGDFAEAEAGVDAYLEENRNYRTNRLQLPAEKRDLIRRRWSKYFRQYGYDDVPQHAAAS